MRLTDDKEQALRMCLAALKSQQRALARGMEEVRLLLQNLEAADEADFHHKGSGHQPHTANRGQQDRHYARRQDRSASPQ